jgi:hypothetical protein
MKTLSWLNKCRMMNGRMQNEDILNSPHAEFFSSFCIHHSAFCISPLAALHLQYSQSLPWVILLLAILSLLVLFIYPAQLRQIPRGLRWLLPTLRLLAVFALGLSILRPVVTRPRVASERAPVVILLDNSASMSVVDSNRPPAEWVGIAAALGKMPADTRDKQLDALQAACDRLSAQADEVIRARAELDYARLSGRGIDASQSRLNQEIQDLQTIARDATKAAAAMKVSGLDRTLAYLAQLPAGVDREGWLDHIRERARMAASYAEQARIASDGKLFQSDANVRDACRPLQLLSRLQLSESAVLDRHSGLLARLGAETSAMGFGISDKVTPIDLSASRPNNEQLAADGSISNLTGGIHAVLESLKAAPPRAVVLFSDGRLIAADQDAATFAALQGVPIYTVGVATRSGLKDLSITNANAPSNASLGEAFTFTAEVRGFGIHGLTDTVTLTGGGPDETRQVTFTDDRPITLNFTRRFTEPGPQRLQLEIEPVPGELTTENNRIERWINVSTTPPKAGVAAHPATRPAMEAEMADLTGDESFLRRISESSGGQFLRLDQVNQLPKRLSDIHDDVSRPMEVPLWDGPYLYALVLGCLAAEWGLRKRFGLV